MSRARCARAPSSCAATARPDTELMRLGDGWVAKGGAEGLLCAARDGLGIALKVEDGAQRPARPGARGVPRAARARSGELADAPVANSRGEVVGELRVTGLATTR